MSPVPWLPYGGEGGINFQWQHFETCQRWFIIISCFHTKDNERQGWGESSSQCFSNALGAANSHLIQLRTRANRITSLLILGFYFSAPPPTPILFLCHLFTTAWRLLERLKMIGSVVSRENVFSWCWEGLLIDGHEIIFKLTMSGAAS